MGSAPRYPAGLRVWSWDRRWHLLAVDPQQRPAAPRGWYWEPWGAYRAYTEDGYRWRSHGPERHVLTRQGREAPGMPPPLEWWHDGSRWQLLRQGSRLPSQPPPAGWPWWWWDGAAWRPAEMPPGPRRRAVRWGPLIAGLVLLILLLLAA